MNKQDQIFNWIKIGLRQPADRLLEIFYFDERDQQFFSILVTDYFMFDQNLDIPEEVTTTYSKKDLETLIDRVKRIDRGDVTIIPLPRLGNRQDIADEEFISQQAADFLNSNAINIEATSIWEVEESGTITIDVKNKSEPPRKKPWWRLWY